MSEQGAALRGARRRSPRHGGVGCGHRWARRSRHATPGGGHRRRRCTCAA